VWQDDGCDLDDFLDDNCRVDNNCDDRDHHQRNNNHHHCVHNDLDSTDLHHD
jgi:hypothetical protein